MRFKKALEHKFRHGKDFIFRTMSDLDQELNVFNVRLALIYNSYFSLFWCSVFLTYEEPHKKQLNVSLILNNYEEIVILLN